MLARLLVLFFFLLLPAATFAATLGNIGSDISFVAKSSLSAIQNLGNGTFSNGERVTGVDIRIGTSAGNLFRNEIRPFIRDSSPEIPFEVPGYLTTVEGDHVYHFDFATPFVPDPTHCYTLNYWQFFNAPTTATTTFYGWSTNQYTASTTGCHPQYASHNINTGLQNPALNGHGLVDYSFLIYTEPIQAPPTIFNLQQFRQFGVDEITEGDTFVGNAAVFKATVADSDSAEVKLEVELKPIDTPFDGSSTFFSPLAAQGTLEAEHNELVPTAEHYTSGGNEKSFHWRARAVDAEGNESAWQEFGTDQSVRDFRAKVVPLWTQVFSNFPARDINDHWFDSEFASGTDTDCGDDSNNDRATVGSCGCAITSAVMLARYYGLEEGMDSSSITPASLNSYLQTHNGYQAETNLLNWSKVLAYLGTTVNNQPHSWFTLETVSSAGGRTHKIRDKASLDTYLATDAPFFAFDDRVGHFFIIDSKLDRPSDISTYALRDPFWYETKTLDESVAVPKKVRRYGNTFAYGTVLTKLPEPRLVTAHAEFFLASPAELLVTDAQGRKVGKDPLTGQSYTDIPGSTYQEEDPIATSETDLDPNSVHKIKSLYLPELPDGGYDVQVIGTGSGTYTLTSTITDSSGDVFQDTATSTTAVNDITGYTLSIEDGAPPTVQPTFLVVTQELRTIITQSGIAPSDKYSLLPRVYDIEGAYSAGNIASTTQAIDGMEKKVKLLQSKKKVTTTVANQIYAILIRLRTLL